MLAGNIGAVSALSLSVTIDTGAPERRRRRT